MQLILPAIQITLIKDFLHHHKTKKIQIYLNLINLFLFISFASFVNFSNLILFSSEEKLIIYKIVTFGILLSPFIIYSNLNEVLLLANKQFDTVAIINILKGIVLAIIFFIIDSIHFINIINTIFLSLFIAELFKTICYKYNFTKNLITKYKESKQINFGSQTFYIIFSTLINFSSLIFLKTLAVNSSVSGQFEIFAIVEQLQGYIFFILFSGVILKFNTEIISENINNTFKLFAHQKNNLYLSFFFTICILLILISIRLSPEFFSKLTNFDKHIIVFSCSLLILYIFTFPLKFINSLLSRLIIHKTKSYLILFLAVVNFLIYFFITPSISIKPHIFSIPVVLIIAEVVTLIFLLALFFFGKSLKKSL